jgi:hypothetical protein
MTKIIRLLLALALAGVTSASADVLIYQFRSVAKAIGEGVEFTSSTRGYLVWNLDDDHFTTLDAGVLSSGRYYKIADGSPLIVRASGWRNREFTTFSSAGGSNGRYLQDYNRGLDATLKLATGRTVRYPRTFKGTSHTLNTSVGPRLFDYARTFVYSSARTIAANDAGKTEEEVVAELRAELESRGYSDLDSYASADQMAGSDSVTIVTVPNTGASSQILVGGQRILPPPPPPAVIPFGGRSPLPASLIPRINY